MDMVHKKICDYHRTLERFDTFDCKMIVGARKIRQSICKVAYAFGFSQTMVAREYQEYVKQLDKNGSHPMYVNAGAP